MRHHADVTGVGVANFLPLDAGWRMPYGLPGLAAVSRADAPEAQIHSVDDGYFAALRAPLVRGREFDARDDSAGRPVVIVNETMARRVWPNQDPVGQRTDGPLRDMHDRAFASQFRPPRRQGYSTGARSAWP